jgi:hypothetical protein
MDIFMTIFLLAAAGEAQVWHDENCFSTETLDAIIPPVIHHYMDIPLGESQAIRFDKNFTLLGAYSMHYINYPIVRVEDFTIDLMYDNSTNILSGNRYADYGCWGNDVVAFPSFSNATYTFPFFVVVNCTFSNMSRCNISVAYTLQDCVPECNGKNCGPDSCGYLCGMCDNTVECSADGICLTPTGNASPLPSEKTSKSTSSNSAQKAILGTSLFFVIFFACVVMFLILRKRRQGKEMQMHPVNT